MINPPKKMVTLHEHEIQVERLKRSGPGGQHRNKRETGIRLTHLPTGIVVMATEERSQAMNLEIAKARLIARLTKLYSKPKKRKKTKIPYGAKAERLRKKKTRSEQKQSRRPVRWE